METKEQKAALSIYFDPSHLIGNQYSVKIYYAGAEPKDRGQMLDSLSIHLNHVVNALAAMLNTSIRDFGIDKRKIYNELIGYLTRMRDSSDFIEFEPPSVNNQRRAEHSPVEIQILYNPSKPREEQYEMVHETYLKKPETKGEVLQVLVADIAHITNGLIYMLNKIVTDFSQDKKNVYNQVTHQLLLIRGFGLELAKEIPTFGENGKVK